MISTTQLSPDHAREIAATFDLKRLPSGFIDDPFPFYRALRELAPVKRLADGAVLLSRYADTPMSLADACLVRLSERHKACRVLTLDQRCC